MPFDKPHPGWGAFCSAVGVELRDHNVIVGMSGVEHPVQAIGVDEKGRRLVVFSSEPSARSAAMMQGDVQATMPDIRVIVARPLAFDTSNLAKLVLKTVQTTELNPALLTDWLNKVGGADSDNAKSGIQNALSRISGPSMDALLNFGLPFVPQAMAFVHQLAGVDPRTLYDPTTGTVRLTEFLTHDNLAQDRKYGVCPIPLYELNASDWEIMGKGDKHQEFPARLKELGIFQYFFPAPDAMVLGLVDRGLTRRTEIISAITRSEQLGHPLTAPEFASVSSIPKILDELNSLGYIAEGEHGVEITEAGKSQRTTIKFRPRESLTSKILARLNVGINFSPKDLLGGS